MCRLSVSVVLLATFCLAYGQSPTKSSTVKPKTSTHVKPTVTPSPSPSPLPKYFNYSYILMDDENKNNTCLHMAVDIALNFTYDTTNGTRNVLIHLLNQTSGHDIVESTVEIDYDNSHCNGTLDDPKAVLTLKYVNVSTQMPYFVIFAFNGSRVPGNMHWSFEKMSVNFTYDASLFPDYKGNAPTNGEKLYTYSGKSLLDDPNRFIELTRPYLCVSNQTISGFVNVTTDNSLNVSLFVRNLEVQAFEFLDKYRLNGTFTSGAERRCLLDSTSGNKIVPIVVGAALGGLVVIVLIAYLIGRIRNKRKSSYQKLS